MRYPNFFILGGPKCGTTTVAHWLYQTPSVFLTDPKEPWYFAPDVATPWLKSLSEYERLYTKADESHLAVGEASTIYLRSHLAVPEILRYRPDARFVVMLRNPIDMAVSLHAQEVFNLHEDLVSFEDAWKAQSERNNGSCIPKSCPYPALLQYGEACMLGAQVEKLFDRVDSNRVKLIFLEELKHDPGKVYYELIHFLGARPFEAVDLSPKNRRKTHKSRLIKQATRQVERLKRHIGVNFQTGLLSPLHRWNQKMLAPQGLPEAVRNELSEYFRKDIIRLQRLSGRQLSHWCERNSDART